LRRESRSLATRTITHATRAKACKSKGGRFMKQGALIFDETADRYDIRFDLADYYGGLHCGECMEVFAGGRWKPTRIEYGENWYLVGVRAEDLNGLRVRILLWSSIFVTFRSKNSLCMSCFKWRLPTIIRMGTDMIIPYAHISPDCFIQTFHTGK